jgi:hypothetical protein
MPALRFACSAWGPRKKEKDEEYYFDFRRPSIRLRMESDVSVG